MKSIFASRFAETVTVTDGSETYVCRAFLRPVSVAAPEKPAISPAGVRDGRRWRIILEPLALSGPETVTVGETEYLMLRHEMIGGGDHIEGLLCRKVRSDDAD